MPPDDVKVVVFSERSGGTERGKCYYLRPGSAIYRSHRCKPGPRAISTSSTREGTTGGATRSASLTIAFFWLGLGYLPYAWFADALAADPLLDFVAVNFSILMMLAGLAVTVRWIHGRSLLTVVTPEARVDWARMARAAAVWVVFAALTAVVEHLLFPDRYYLSFDPQRFSVLRRGGHRAHPAPVRDRGAGFPRLRDAGAGASHAASGADRRREAACSSRCRTS